MLCETVTSKKQNTQESTVCMKTVPCPAGRKQFIMTPLQPLVSPAILSLILPVHSKENLLIVILICFCVTLCNYKTMVVLFL